MFSFGRIGVSSRQLSNVVRVRLANESRKSILRSWLSNCSNRQISSSRCLLKSVDKVAGQISEKANLQVDDSSEEARMKRNVLINQDAEVHWEYNQDFSSAKLYDKKPVQVNCKEGRIYLWCACGNSKSQPFCDGTHRLQHFKISIKPIPWTCRETGQYWFCNCKRSSRRPFCDGSHLEEAVQEAKDATVRY